MYGTSDIEVIVFVIFVQSLKWPTILTLEPYTYSFVTLTVHRGTGCPKIENTI